MGFFVNPGPLLYPLREDLRHYSEKDDIYSLGVVMFRVSTQCSHGEGELSRLPEDHPLKPIILQCLRDEPGQRPDSAAVFRMLSEGETVGQTIEYDCIINSCRNE